MTRHFNSEKGRSADSQCSLAHDNSETHLGTCFPGVSSLRGMLQIGSMFLRVPLKDCSWLGLTGRWGPLEREGNRLGRWLSSQGAHHACRRPTSGGSQWVNPDLEISLLASPGTCTRLQTHRHRQTDIYTHKNKSLESVVN